MHKFALLLRINLNKNETTNNLMHFIATNSI
jgi:hypothetical protein